MMEKELEDLRDQAAEVVKALEELFACPGWKWMEDFENGQRKGYTARIMDFALGWDALLEKEQEKGLLAGMQLMLEAPRTALEEARAEYEMLTKQLREEHENG